MSRSFQIAAIAAVLALIASEAWAQRQNPVQQPAQPRVQQAQPGQAGPQQRTVLRPQQGRESMADHQIASWLVLANEAEASLGQWAAQQTQTKEVRQFAEMMAKDHGASVNQLRQFAPDVPKLQVGQQSRTGEPGQPQAAQPQQQAAAQPPAQVPQQRTSQNNQLEQPANQQGLPMMQISLQIAERNLNSLQKELGRKQGSEFDKAYLGSQIFAHSAILNTQEVLRPYASPQLQTLIDEAIQQTQAHLQKARQLCDSLGGGNRSDEKQDRQNQ